MIAIDLLGMRYFDYFNSLNRQGIDSKKVSVSGVFGRLGGDLLLSVGFEILLEPADAKRKVWRPYE